MKMSIASIAVTVACMVSLVLAADQPSAMMASDQTMLTSKMRGGAAPSVLIPVGVITNKIDAKGNNVVVDKSNILISKSDRITLAKTIERMMSTNSKAATMTTDDVLALLTRAAENPVLFKKVADIITAARSGDQASVANNVVVLLGVVFPRASTTTVVASTSASELVTEPAAATST